MDLSVPFRLIADKFNHWIKLIWAMMPNLVVAVIVVIAFLVIARYTKKLLLSILGRFSSNRSINRLLASFTSLAIIITGLFIALGVLSLDKTVTTLLAGIGIVGLALGFAFQDIISNLISGVILSFRRPFVHGDLIETNDHFGTVHSLNLRTTNILTLEGQMAIIPNKDVFQKPLVNYNAYGKRMVVLKAGVSYGDDLEKAKSIALEAVNSLDYIDRTRESEMYYEEFADSSINFIVRFWILFKKQTDYLQARSDALMRIKKSFEENEISIPFPIRTLDFGIKGGEGLSQIIKKGTNLS